MKKSLLLVCLFITGLLNAQVKHNKFSTKIKHAQFNPSFQFDATLVGEIDDQSGYMLSTQYDDGSGGIHPTVVKLDVEGNIVFDTIYEFTPNNALGGLQMIDAITTLTNHVILYESGSHGPVGESPPAPYVVNMDVNGNINWQVGLQDDTLELYPHRMIQTQDGGYVIAGRMWDVALNTHKPAGFLIKLDANGTILWDSLYRDTDTLSFEFNAIVETPDGGLLVAGIAPQYHNNTDTPLLLAKMNSLGSVIWSKVQKLATPILPNYGPDEINLGMINNTDAVVTYEVHNASIVKEIAMTSFVANTGANNWTKTYSSGSAAEMTFGAFDGKGNIVLNAMDTTNQSVIFHFDDQGNFLRAKSFMTFWPSPANHFPLGIIPTLDGGFIHTNYIDQDDVLVVKTDGDLDPSCAGVDSLYPYTLIPSINMDTSYFGVLDSAYTIPYMNPVTLSGGTPFNTVADDSVICNCNNTIQGNVTEGGSTPVNNAKVYLFRKGVVPSPWSPVDSTLTDVAGFYQFNYVATDSFLVKVEPDTSLFPGAMTSYFKEPIWCYRWDLAGVIATHCDSGVVIKDVKLVTPPTLTGNSTITGYVFESTGSFNKQMQPGDPIPDIDITVDQSPSGIVGGSTSQGNGYYSLAGLDTNATYIITIDFPGLPHDSVWTININFQDTIMDSLNFYIDSTGIYILEDNLGTGMDVVQTANMDVDLYPNPTTGLFTVRIDALKPEDIELQLTNGVGKVITTIDQRVMGGENNITIDDTESLPPGIYFLKIREGSNYHIKKIVKL